MCVFGYVLRKDVLARELFLEIEKEYLDSTKDSSKDSSKDVSQDSTKDSSKDVSQDSTKDASQGRRRKVFFATNNGSDWTVANNQSYWAILLRDAGAEYVGATEGKGNLNFDKERMLFALNEADAYGELVYFPNVSNVSLSSLHPEFIQTVPFQHKNIFTCNAANNGFFDKALLEPHVLLQELMQVMVDSTFSGNYFQHTH
jgi:hypothetical protein